jgi:predicted patatin/cPLA2 family phospholipase
MQYAILLPAMRSLGVVWLSRLTLALLLCLLIGCSVSRQPHLEADATKAQIAGFENVRFLLDGQINPSISKRLKTAGRRAPRKFLAISGGGAGGAFSVGVLKAWSERGDRPVFDLVSGVSTGALIAPFAFLGTKYDAALEHLYTSGVAAGLLDRKFIVRGLLGESLYFQKPLKDMVERYVDKPLLNEIAGEYRKGRNLFVLTTNLDTQRAVLWDMGAIANSPQPEALSLFQNVLIASASIPGVFPAVQIKAVVDGKLITEMHSDGGPSAQIMTVPEAILSDVNLPVPPDTRGSDMYLLVNNALMPEFAVTPNSTLAISTRAYSILVKSQTRQALYAVYEYCNRVGIGFHMATIDVTVPYQISDPFNTDYMRSVFKLGYEKMLQGRLWRDRPTFPQQPPSGPF